LWKRRVAVRKSRCSIEQIVAVRKRVEMGMPVADVMRELGISDQTIYLWKKPYSGLQPDQAREIIDAWRRDHDESRPHTPLAWAWPSDLARQVGTLPDPPGVVNAGCWRSDRSENL
jgi:putative transposase